MSESIKQLRIALKAKVGEVMYVKGSFISKAGTRYSITKARKITGIVAPKRNFTQRISAYGDWAIVAKMNGIS